MYKIYFFINVFYNVLLDTKINNIDVVGNQ